MEKERREEVVFSGPSYLYREPRCNTKCAKLLMGVADVSSVPTRSVPAPSAGRLVSSFSNSMGMDRARRDCSAAMSSILTIYEGAKREGGRFLDADFFLGKRDNLYPTGSSPDTHVAEPRDLVSLCDLYPHIEVIGEQFEPQNRQYIIPTCRSTHMVAAAEALLIGGHRDRLKSLFVTPGDKGLSITEFVRRFGFIGVLLYVNGEWEWVIVDDLVATDIKGTSPTMLHLISKGRVEALQNTFGPNHITAGTGRAELPNRRGKAVSHLDSGDDPVELWPHLLQKAWAKWQGCYEEVDGGSPRAAMEQLTGGCTRQCHVMHEDSMAAYDEFDDSSSQQVCLVYCSRVAKGGPKRREHVATATVYLEPKRSPPVWLPTKLPLVLKKCYTSNEDACPMVHLASPWGVLSEDGSNEVALEWAEFIELCEYYELCSLPDPNQVYVEGFGTSSNGATQEFMIMLKAPLRSPVAFSLRQSDPRTNLNLPIEVRRRLPFISLGIVVTDPLNKRVVYQSPKRVVAKECLVDLQLVPGEYSVKLLVDETPSVPYSLRASVSTLVNLRMWPKGLHPEVHGASSAKIKFVTQDSHHGLTSDNLRSLADKPTGRPGPTSAGNTTDSVPTAVKECFSAVDVADRGLITVRGAERAAAEYYFSHTEEGRRVRAAIEAQLAQGGGSMTLRGFNSVISTQYPTPD
eukprot:GILI01021768.1.p1 GENE.GILI01021768.1~~GILI01021768.1.p1  ORF type:complete len:750 (+),score=94.92 GILI01021768.1:192-2252(+)